ncbi:hypothetical protein CXU14_09400 [Akkermansia muciniphila]|nr:hypothetical protein CXU14_09400 [Akkermansia muciniphila]
MKLTPEQKAWFEYGRSRGWLKAHRSKKYFADVPDMGLYAWHVERDMHGLDALIRDAWQKRAACRAWLPLKERNCKNCMHLHRDMKSGSPCSDCPGIDDEIPSNWEPRKEAL